MEKISIIIPVYNAEKTLPRCIGSVLAQTYENIEVLCIDDGSSDGSVALLEEIAARDPRLHCIKKAHAGVSEARNLGLDLATGDYIQFVDADDDIEPDMTETLLRAAKENNAELVVCNFTHPCIKSFLGDAVLDMTTREGLLTYYLSTFTGHLPWNKLWKRETITEKFDCEVHFCEDGLFNLANMVNAKKLVSVDRVLYHYYVAPPDISEEEMSCINKIARSDKFWETKETYWYKLDALLGKQREIIRKKYAKYDANEFLFPRVFDFMIWELLILSSMGIDKHGLEIEIRNIFDERDFRSALASKGKYGIIYRPFDARELDFAVKEFVDACYAAGEDIERRKSGLKTYFVMLGIFCRIFVDDIAPAADTVDPLVRTALEIRDGSTPEAKYANKIYLQSPELSDAPDDEFEFGFASALDTDPEVLFS